MPLIKTPECSKLKKSEKMWVACCHFQELFCFTDANAPLLSLSCAIISISMGKVAWSSLWPYLLNRDPAWHDEKFVLNGLRPSSMASGDVFIWSMPTQREDQQWEEVTQQCPHRSGYCWAFCLLPLNLPALWCSCFSQPDTRLCHVSHSKIQSLCGSISPIEMEEKNNMLQAVGKRPAESPC